MKVLLKNSNNNYQLVNLIEERDDSVSIVEDKNLFVAVNSNRIIKL